jgi:hypothetical protein
MAILSLGTATIFASYAFDQDFEILPPLSNPNGPNHFVPIGAYNQLARSVQTGSSTTYTLTGNEGHGVIRFLGAIQVLSVRQTEQTEQIE